MKKNTRQSKIEQLINQYPISTQDELLSRLNEAGIKATQATISRDIREMQMVKQQDASGVSRYVIYKAGNQNELQHLYRAIGDTVTSITRVQFMNIVHTLPSYANMLAAILDDINLPEVAGTLAGHDTIVIISTDVPRSEQLNDLFRTYISQDLAQ